MAQNRLYDCGVEHDQQILRQVVLPKLAQEVHPLLGLLDDRGDVGFALQMSGDCRSQKPEGFHSQHSTVVYDEGGQCWGAPPEVHCHLHGFKLSLTTSSSSSFHVFHASSPFSHTHTYKHTCKYRKE